MNFTTLLKPLSPAAETVKHYSLGKLRRDLLAGLTVSVVEVPQAMAYAIIAGVPPVYGLYTSILQGIIGALLSSSEHMTTGPTNTQSLLIASAIKTVALPHADPVVYLQLVFGLTLLKGLIQLTFAAARLGDLVRYVSRSVIIGLVAGAGVLIIVGQLPSFLGVDIAQVTTRLPDPIGRIDVVNRLDRTLQLLPQTNWRAVMIGAIVVGVILAMRMISRLLPGALTGVIIAAGIVIACGWDGSQLRLIDRLPEGLPMPINPWPGLDYARELLPGALALAILGMLESVAIAKSLAARTGERISANQEFFAQGLKNTITSFFQCIPGSGSFTRSALDYEAGAATRFAAVFNGIFVAIIFLLLADWARFIPLASLAGVLFVIAFGLIDWRQILQIVRTDRSDAIVCIATFAATLLVPLEYAIFIGIFLNLALYLRVASRLHLAEMVQTPGGGGQFIEMPLRDRAGHKKVMFLQMEGDLFFGVADELQDQLRLLSRSGVRVVILRLRRTHSIDSTILHVLEQFARSMQSRGGHVVLCGVTTDLMRTLRAYGLIDLLGKQNVFERGGGVFTSAKRALQRAKELVGSSIDAPAIALDEREEIDYEI